MSPFLCTFLTHRAPRNRKGSQSMEFRPKPRQRAVGRGSTKPKKKSGSVVCVCLRALNGNSDAFNRTFYGTFDRIRQR